MAGKRRKPLAGKTTAISLRLPIGLDRALRAQAILDRQLQQAIDKRKGSLKITSDALNVVSAQAGKIYRLTEEVDSLRASLIDRDLRTAAYVATLANEEHGHGYARMASYACSELEQVEQRTVARIVEWLRSIEHDMTAAGYYADRIEHGDWKAK